MPMTEVAAGARVDVQGPGQGEIFRFAGLSCRPIVRGEDSAEAYTLIEITAGPSKGSPYHICHWEDKAIYVMEGAFRIRIGDRTVAAGPGTSVRIPSGVPHSFTSVGDEAGRLMVALTPSGHERMFEELCRLTERRATRKEMVHMFARYGVELLPDA